MKDILRYLEVFVNKRVQAYIFTKKITESTVKVPSRVVELFKRLITA